MNADNLNKSKRFNPVLKYLASYNYRPKSTRQIRDACDVCAVNSIIDELRDKGFNISCKAKYDKKLGKNIYYYKLEG